MNKTSKIIFSLAFALVFIGVIVMSSVPPVSRDAQTHHLALPKIWLSEGMLAEVPDMEFSYYPQLLDLLYVLPVAMDMDIVAKYVHFSFGLGTLLLLFLYIRRKIGTFWGLIGGLMFLTLPIIIKLSVTVYVDLGVLFFFTASLLSSLTWLENTKKIRWLIIAGICSGLAMSTKYNAMLSVTLLALLLGYFFLQTRRNKVNEQLNVIKYLAIFSFFALLVYSPWLIRNYSLTGNPIYPLHQSLFVKSNPQKGSDDLLVKKPENMKPLLYRKLVYNESLPYTLAIPLRIFYEGRDDSAKYFDGRLNPLLLFFTFLLFLGKKKRWQNQFLAVFTVLTLFYTLFAVEMRIRYVITIVSPMIILSVFGLFQLSQWLQTKVLSNKIKYTVLTALISTYFIYNLSFSIKLFKKIDPIPYISGKISRDEYLNKELPYYSLNKLANNTVTPDGKLLAIYTGNRRYYIDVPLTLESSLLFTIAGKIDGAPDLAQELLKRNITHILVRVDLFKNELLRKETKVQNIINQFFSKHVELLASKSVFALYEINSL